MPHRAGCDTDRLIAEKVLGMQPAARVPDAFQPTDPAGNPMPISAPRYTDDIRAAWQIGDVLAAGGYDVAIFTTRGPARANGTWTFAVASADVGAKAQADTPMLAICRAALALAGEG